MLRGGDARRGETLRLGAAGERRGEGREGEKAHPIAHARDRRDQPQPTERRNGEDRPYPVRGGCGWRRNGCADGGSPLSVLLARVGGGPDKTRFSPAGSTRSTG